MQLQDMYQEIILDHYRNPHHKGLRDPFDAQVYHVNPTCGDEVTLRVALKPGVDGEAVVEDVSFESLGCSISQASASVMTDLVIGKPVSEAMKIEDAFPRADEVQGTARAGRGRPRGRGGFRRRVEVPGADQVRAAWLDGLEGCHRPGALWHRPPALRLIRHPLRTQGTGMTENAAVPTLTDEQVKEKTEDILEALHDVVDPELGINVVDLGLIYGVLLDGPDKATLDMTLTSAACPLTDVIEEQAAEALKDTVEDFTINWCGCRRGVLRTSPTTGASSSGRSASTFSSA